MAKMPIELQLTTEIYRWFGARISRAVALSQRHNCADEARSLLGLYLAYLYLVYLHAVTFIACIFRVMRSSN